MTVFGNPTPPGPRSALLRVLLSLLEEEIPMAVELRRRLHSDPELGGEEHETVGLVADMLPVRGKTFADTGLLASLGDPDSHAVWVRAELDGLELTETTGVPFASRKGRMHACGHDVHLAALVALFRAAYRIQEDLPARLVAVFQPSEERHPSGALALVNDPTLTEGVRAAVAAHVHPELPWGSIGAEPTTVNAAADAMHIVVTGAGGHAGYPHRTVDPVLALAHIVVGLHGLVGRRVDPVHAATLTVGYLQAGTTENVVPDTAEARVTFRALDEYDQRRLRAAVTEMVTHIAAANGCTATISLTKSEPPLVNDEQMADAARASAPQAGFSIAPPWRSCGGDDFAHYGAVCPALMVFVGLQGAPGFRPASLHQPDFLPPEESVSAVARALALAFVAGVSTVTGG
jgi:amidohydrolase